MLNIFQVALPVKRVVLEFTISYSRALPIQDVATLASYIFSVFVVLYVRLTASLCLLTS